MRSDSEQRDVPALPVSVSMAVRAPRVVVLVPPYPEVAWQRSFEAILAHRAGVWGGAGDLLFPLQDDLTSHELFWRLTDIFDADVYLVDRLSGSDLREMDPAAFEKRRVDFRAQFPGSDESFLDDLQLAHGVIPADLHALILRRLAPVHLRRDPGQEPDAPTWSTGYAPAMKTSALAGLPTGVSNVRTTLGATESLLLTSELGRLDRDTEQELTRRDIAITTESIDHVVDLGLVLYTDHQQGRAVPWTLSQHGLSTYVRALTMFRPPVVVVGDDPWDFALFYALRKISAATVLWFPSDVERDPLLANRFWAHLRKRR